MEKERKQNDIPKSTEGTGRINLALIASGSGTDADSIMAAWEIGCIPEINPPLLISTKKGVGCLEKVQEPRITLGGGRLQRIIPIWIISIPHLEQPLKISLYRFDFSGRVYP